MDRPEPYSDAVARFVRTYRQAHGLTLDAVATAGREYGATWGTASVRNIEAGKLAPTLPTLLILALALGKLTGESLRLSDLLGDTVVLDLPVRGADGHPVRRRWVDRVLSGQPVRLAPEDVVATTVPTASETSASLAEQRAAQKLGISVDELQEWANRLWGRTLEQESADRAGDGSTPQARGRVTRKLVEEIRDSIEYEAEGRRDAYDHWLSTRF